MKFLAGITALFLMLAQSTYAGTQAKPDKCPSVSALAAVGVSMTQQAPGYPTSWDGFELKNRFDTNDEWTFVIGEFKTEDQDEALLKANAAITRLAFSYGPELDNNRDWYCMYYGKGGKIFGLTVTPPIKIDETLVALRHRP